MTPSSTEAELLRGIARRLDSQRRLALLLSVIVAQLTGHLGWEVVFAGFLIADTWLFWKVVP